MSWPERVRASKQKAKTVSLFLLVCVATRQCHWHLGWVLPPQIFSSTKSFTERPAACLLADSRSGQIDHQTDHDFCLSCGLSLSEFSILFCLASPNLPINYPFKLSFRKFIRKELQSMKWPTNGPVSRPCWKMPVCLRTAGF